MDEKKMANNILEFLLDPTKIPVKNRLYFRPEEILDNRVYENAKMESLQSYGNQNRNSDMYPERKKGQSNRLGGIQMDRRTLIASLDVLSQKFASEQDPIAKDLRTMAYAVSQMSDEEYGSRLTAEEEPVEGTSKEAADVEAKKYETFKCPECGTKVLKQTGYCVKCKKKVKEAAEEQPAVDDFWNKAASDMVKSAILEDHGYEAAKEPVVEEQSAEEVPAEKPAEEPAEEPVKEEAEPVEAKKVEKEEPEKTAGKIKGPGKPDGTGPYGGTPECQMSEKKEEEKKAEEKEPEKEEPEAEKESKVVDTSILEANQKFGDIELDSMSQNIDAVELDADDHKNLDNLFEFTNVKNLTADEKDRFDQLFK